MSKSLMRKLMVTNFLLLNHFVWKFIGTKSLEWIKSTFSHMLKIHQEALLEGLFDFYFQILQIKACQPQAKAC